jgi:hypothetical protein
VFFSVITREFSSLDPLVSGRTVSQMIFCKQRRSPDVYCLPRVQGIVLRGIWHQIWLLGKQRKLIFRTIDPMVVITAGLHNGVAGVLSADLLRVFRWYPFGPMC